MAYQNKEKYIGIMSGTSLDGVDVVLCEIDAQECELVHEITHPIPHGLKEAILQMIADTATLETVGEIDHRLGVLFAEAVNSLLEQYHIDPATITAIGSHGQTLWHAPQGKYPFTMQLGDPNIITALTGIPVVADFRRKDMAFGGQGAPIAPAFHEFIFGNINERLAVVNIGGIANITLLGEKPLGYDTGPGNVLMDAWIEQHQGTPYDKDGAWARSGSVDYRLLDVMMADEYFSKPYPKSTGREKFNIKWVESVQRVACSVQENVVEALHSNANNNSSLPPKDVQRTLLELTALTISNEVLTFNPDMLMLCGGGAQNGFLVERIAALMPNVQVGVMAHAESLEAMMMAWLAYKRLHNETVALKDVTGAQNNTILGGVYR